MAIPKQTVQTFNVTIFLFLGPFKILKVCQFVSRIHRGRLLAHMGQTIVHLRREIKSHELCFNVLVYRTNQCSIIFALGLVKQSNLSNSEHSRLGKVSGLEKIPV